MSKLMQVDKSWGSETWFQNNELYCGKELFVYKNRTSSEGMFHYHKIKDETFYIMTGVLLIDYYMPINNTVPDLPIQVILAKSDCFRIRPLVRHRFRAMHRDCRFIEVSTHHEDSDSYYEG
jgi:mannose-6-phosphate isomerase-like protein (cupin superfamily)